VRDVADHSSCVVEVVRGQGPVYSRWAAVTAVVAGQLKDPCSSAHMTSPDWSSDVDR
jgi:hypothetical protein